MTNVGPYREVYIRRKRRCTRCKRWWYTYESLDNPFDETKLREAKAASLSEGRRLRAMRIVCGLTQADIAIALGKSPAWVSLVERGFIQLTPFTVKAYETATKGKKRD